MEHVQRAGSKIQDEESKAILFQGASISQLARLFKRDNRSVQAKLVGVAPCGMRAGSPIYAVVDAAPYLVTPAYDMDEFIRRMTVSDLPMLVRKEFWAGMRSKQLHDKEAGETWQSSEVMEFIAELMKTLKMSILLTRDNVERETELTPRQRDIILRIIDGCLGDLNANVIKRFRSDAAAAEAMASPEEDEDGEL